MISSILMAFVLFGAAGPSALEFDAQVESIVSPPAKYASGRLTLSIPLRFSPGAGRPALVHIAMYWTGNDRLVLQPVELEVNRAISSLQGEILSLQVPLKAGKHMWAPIERQREI